MASKEWLLVEWISKSRKIPSYGVINVNTLGDSEIDLEPGSIISVPRQDGHFRKAKILLFSDNKKHLQEHKEIMDSQRQQILNVCMQTIKRIRSMEPLNAKPETSNRSLALVDAVNNTKSEVIGKIVCKNPINVSTPKPKFTPMNKNQHSTGKPVRGTHSSLPSRQNPAVIDVDSNSESEGVIGKIVHNKPNNASTPKAKFTPMNKNLHSTGKPVRGTHSPLPSRQSPAVMDVHSNSDSEEFIGKSVRNKPTSVSKSKPKFAPKIKHQITDKPIRGTSSPLPNSQSPAVMDVELDSDSEVVGESVRSKPTSVSKSKPKFILTNKNQHATDKPARVRHSTPLPNSQSPAEMDVELDSNTDSEIIGKSVRNQPTRFSKSKPKLTPKNENQHSTDKPVPGTDSQLPTLRALKIKEYLKQKSQTKKEEEYVEMEPAEVIALDIAVKYVYKQYIMLTSYLKSKGLISGSNGNKEATCIKLNKTNVAEVTSSTAKAEKKIQPKKPSVRRVLAETTNNELGNDADLVPIGNGNAKVPARLLKDIDWSSHSVATRLLLDAIFPRRVLATHSLTGKPSPAFKNRPAKERLNPKLIEDIVNTVSTKSGVSRNYVRSAITIKCADEAKLHRNRLKFEETRKRSRDENEENISPISLSGDENEFLPLKRTRKSARLNMLTV
ncbi:hypothetical protein PYW08_005133 [Mythimna loreyi]|uniref:Uncharacterized protein n=1 Tax=Mythimna loreyi TaxID=667449 RepID=A0ACC2QGU4_9NEOP|nr:hypothetical protein PYW08_005133 [Mythimna loreyi]